MVEPFCNACSLPLDVSSETLEVRVEAGSTLALVAYSCGCLPLGRTRAEWEAAASEQGLTL